jgi:hypothetical protein
LRPSIDLVSPNHNQTIHDNSFTLEVNVSAPRGVERVEYFIDEQKVGQSASSPFSFTYQVNPLLSNGRHQLKAMAFDDQDNWQEDSINFDLQSDRSSDDFSLLWLEPDNGANFSLDDLPISAHIKITNPDQIKKIDFYYLDPDDDSHWFAYSEYPGEDIYTNWGDNIDEPGVYKLYLIVKDISNRLISAPPIIINIQ